MKGISRVVALLLVIVVTSQAGWSQLALGKAAAANTSPGLVTTGALTIIPILTTEKANMGRYISLAEATKRGLVEIVEVPGQEQVNALEVRNKADLPLLLLAGELLVGGKQDRIVAKDFIVPPPDGAKVPVFCVEHGRWQPGAKEFKGGDLFVPDQVRSTAVMNDPAQKALSRGGMGGQSQVWEQVGRVNEAAQRAPSTGTVRGTLDDPEIRRKVEALTDKLDQLVGNSSRVVGMMVWLDGKILSADVFANHSLFDASRMKLLRSYAVDFCLIKNPRNIPVDIPACQAFLVQVLSAKRDLDAKGDFGNIYEIRSGKVIGYESGAGNFGGGSGGAARAGFGHGTYKPGG